MNRKMMIPALVMGMAVLFAAPNMSAQAAETPLTVGTMTVEAGEEYTFTPSSSCYYEFKGISEGDTELSILDGSGNYIEWAADSYDAAGSCINNDFDTVVWLEANTAYTVKVDMEEALNDSVPEISLLISDKVKVSLKSVSSASASGVTVSWYPLNTTSEPCYAIYRKDASATGWSGSKRVGLTYDTSFVDTSAVKGKSYTYTVRTCKYTSPTTVGGSSYDTTGLTITYLADIKSLTLTNTSSAMNIKWAQVTGASGYYVYRRTSSTSYKVIATVKSGSTVSYNDTAVASKNGSGYTYAVRAYRGSDKGAYTGVYTVRLTAPTLSSLSNTATCKLTGKWTQNTKASGYVLQYATNSSFTGYKNVAISGNTTVSKTLTGLTKGSTYYVRVRAYRTVSGKKYYSAWSNKKYLKISR